jgi:hypothetical protein
MNTVILVTSKLKMLYVHRTKMVLANPKCTNASTDRVAVGRTVHTHSKFALWSYFWLKLQTKKNTSPEKESVAWGVKPWGAWQWLACGVEKNEYLKK